MVVLVAMTFIYGLVVGPSGDDIPVMSFISGTEYNVDEAGQVIVEARYATGMSALDGPCTIFIWYPNKTLFLEANGTAGPNGNQYIEFIVPNLTGVYEYQANCSLEGNRRGVISKSFHVSEFQNDTLTKLSRIRAVIPK